MEQNIHTTTSQSVRFHNTTKQIQTHFNPADGIEYLFLEDVQQYFRSVSVLCIDDVILSFRRGENGNLLKPLRIEACKDKVVEALVSIEQSNDTTDSSANEINTDYREMYLDIRHMIVDIDKKVVTTVLNTQETLENTRETLIRLGQVMRQMYELDEYTTPRHFFILPAKYSAWEIASDVKTLLLLPFKLYFLCECSDEPGKMHGALHDGYLIKKPRDFIVKYGPYIQVGCEISKVLLTLGGFVIPQLANFVKTIPGPANSAGIYSGIKSQVELVEKLVNQTNNRPLFESPSVRAKAASKRAPLQGADLRELKAHLQTIDRKNTLGNLYRKTTMMVMFRWLCLEHFDITAFNNKVSEYIDKFEAFGGKFNQETKEAIVTEVNLTTKNIEMLRGALTKGFNILSLTFEKCSFIENDLDELFHIIINRSSIRCLIISTITIKIPGRLFGIFESEYICKYMSVRIKNESLDIQVSKDFQVGDMKMLNRLWLKNKVCQTVYLSGCDFQGFGKDLRNCLQMNPESTTLVMRHLYNIEFLFDILNSKSSLKHLILSFWSSPPPALFRFCEILEKNSTLTSLSIIDYLCFDDDDFTIKLLTTLRGHKSIKCLTFHVCNLKPSDPKEICLMDTLLNDSFISRLHISVSIISNEFVKAVIHASKKINSLTHLQFYDCQINENDVSTLEMLNTNGNLTYLTFSKEPYWLVAAAEMRRQLQDEINQNSKLQQYIQQRQSFSVIDLSKWEFTDRDMSIVIKEAIINKQCTELYLGSNKITFVGASMLAAALYNNKTLRSLRLDFNQVCDRGVYFLAKILSSNNNILYSLSLYDNGITDEGAKYLAQMIKTNKTLTHLSLGTNKITDDGIQLLASAIENDNTTIQWLDLSDNSLLTEKSVDYLLQMIEHNQSLARLAVEKCDFSEKGKKRLKKLQKSKNNFLVYA